MRFVKARMLLFCIVAWKGSDALSFADVDVTKQYPPDVSFMVIDLKYQPGSLKICEFGEGFLSGFIGHEMIYGKGKVLQALWPFLKSFQKPCIYFADKRSIGALGDKIQPINRLSNLSKTRDAKYSLSDIDAIAVGFGKKTFFDSYEHNGALDTGLLAVDYATRKFALHKGYMHKLFEGDPLVERYRPQCKIIKREYSPDLALSILIAIPADEYVIKPLNAWKGDGIVMVNAAELDAKLQQILPCDGRTVDVAQGYWAKTRASHFIIETLEHSILVSINKKQYDPTMRVILGLSYDGGVVGMELLGAYWKMPTTAVGAKATLEDKYVSHIIATNKQSSALVTPEVLRGVEHELWQFIPHVYKKMVAITHDKELQKRMPNLW